MSKRGRDTQLVELFGKQYVTAELFQAGFEVAQPVRDKNIDLVAYLPKNRFIARPLQVKAATKKSFSIDRKYKKVQDIILVYVWHVKDPASTEVYALTYEEALKVAKEMGWTITDSWKKKERYSNSAPGKKLNELMVRYKMDRTSWKKKLSQDER